MALDAGINFINTADFYGMGHNESLVGRAIKGRRDEAFLSVKCGMMKSPSGDFLGLDGRPDPDVPYEDTIGAIAELIEEGKVRHLGVSEVGADLLRRAHDVHPVTALEIEYSLACRFIEPEILPAVRELGVGLVPYHVLASGLLTGALSEEPPEGEASHLAPPRVQGEHRKKNIEAVQPLKGMAAEKGHAPAQLAIAWLLARGEDVVPLVGTSRRSRLRENVEVLYTSFSEDELDRAFVPGTIVGGRYPDFVQQFAAG